MTNAVRDLPIIFSAPMVRALLEGRKTMTRRLAWRAESVDEPHKGDVLIPGRGILRPSPWQKVKPGDRLWVRENFAFVGTSDPGHLVFAATYPRDLPAHMENVPDDIHDAGYKWTPCIHMPRKFSRLTLVVTATKIERLQDISEADCIAEGCAAPDANWYPGGQNSERELSARCAFSALWQSLHGAESWDANPEVVALTFTVFKVNIDDIRRFNRSIRPEAIVTNEAP